MYKQLQKLFSLEPIYKKIFLIISDVLIIIFSFLFSMTLRLDNYNFIYKFENVSILLVLVPLTIIIFFLLRLYTAIVRYISTEFIYTLAQSIAISSILLFIISNLFKIPVPRSVPLIFFICCFIFIGGFRFSIRSIYLKIQLLNAKKVAIFDDDNYTNKLTNIISKNTEYNPMIIFSYNRKSIFSGLHSNSIPKTTYENNKKLIEELNIDVIFITNKDILNDILIKNDFLKLLKKMPIKIKILKDNVFHLNENNFNFSFEDLSIETLMERNRKLQNNEINFKNINNLNILVTGAGGSIGSELTKQILMNNPKSIYLIDHSEYALYRIQKKILSMLEIVDTSQIEIKFILGSIQNKNFLLKIFKNFKIDTIFHAAPINMYQLLNKTL